MNFGALKSRCAFRYRDTTNRQVTATEWGDYVNDAYREVQASSPDWPWMRDSSNDVLTFFPGVNSLDLSQVLSPVPYRVTAAYNMTDDIRLIPLSEADGTWFDLFPDAENSGKRGTPTHYRLLDGALEVLPYPQINTKVWIEYLAPVSSMSSDSGSPAFPEHYHEALIHGALSRAYEDEGDFARSDRHRTQFLQTLQAMKHDLLLPQTEGYPGVRDDFF